MKVRRFGALTALISGWIICVFTAPHLVDAVWPVGL
jgi:hypothetical protein